MEVTTTTHISTSWRLFRDLMALYGATWDVFEDPTKAIEVMKGVRFGTL